MRKSPQKLYTAFCIGIFSLALCACGKLGIDTNVSPADIKPKEINTKLPNKFPVPVYLGADVKNVTEVPMGKAGLKSYVVDLESSDDITKITGYYAYTLTRAGWSVKEMKMESYGISSAKCLVASNGNNQITINIGQSGNKTSIQISLTPISSYSPTSK